MVFAAAARLLPLARDGSGSAAVYTALMMPLLLGVLGLGVDVSLWYAAKRSAQSIADAAAMAGALELARAGSVGAAFAAAEEDAALNGYDPDAGDVLTVNSPPASGPSAGRATAVEAVVRLTPPAPFSRLFLDRPPLVAARAAAEAPTAASGCSNRRIRRWSWSARPTSNSAAASMPTRPAPPRST